ncbi:histone H2B 1-like [Abrus precatorius]|uniref:Histone H2B 1-like n=1 Tax=Abrus precatorius TaxID=3816 RepID=A0A8B8KM56_ABRPR|nr:histone H2B 1-like [Abrus precatorius]
MAPKRGQKVVVRSTRKVVQETMQVSVVSSSKRSTRGNRDLHIGEEHVRIITVEEVTPQAQEGTSTTTITTEDKTKQENTSSDQVQHETDEQRRHTPMGAQTEEPKEPSAKKEQEKANTQEGNDGKEKRRRKKRVKRNGEGYQRYVYRVLKQVHPEMGISSQAMTVLNNLMNDMFERLADEAAKLKSYEGHMTLSSREIQGAVKLVLPGDLGKHAIAEGAKAVANCISHDA